MNPLFGLSVRALITDSEGKSLLLRRSDSSGHYAGQWEWPGGKCDPGETINQALRREVMEETGLQIDVTDYLGADDFKMSEIHAICLFLKAEAVRGEMRLSREHDDFCWLHPEKYIEMELSDNTRSFMLKHWREKGSGK
jgi:8-oxo-dGTP diphosphatase